MSTGPPGFPCELCWPGQAGEQPYWALPRSGPALSFLLDSPRACSRGPVAGFTLICRWGKRFREENRHAEGNLSADRMYELKAGLCQCSCTDQPPPPDPPCPGTTLWVSTEGCGLIVGDWSLLPPGGHVPICRLPHFCQPELQSCSRPQFSSPRPTPLFRPQFPFVWNGPAEPHVEF